MINQSISQSKISYSHDYIQMGKTVKQPYKGCVGFSTPNISRWECSLLVMTLHTLTKLLYDGTG